VKSAIEMKTANLKAGYVLSSFTRYQVPMTKEIPIMEQIEAIPSRIEIFASRVALSDMGLSKFCV